jgi:Rod binding domain-containing protein
MADLQALTTLSPSADLMLSRETVTAGRMGWLAASSNATKVRQAAEEFESVLLTQWLEQARQSFTQIAGDDDSDSDDPGGDQMLSLGTQSLASAVAKSGGIGIARFLTRHLEGASSELHENRSVCVLADSGRSAEKDEKTTNGIEKCADR